MRIIHYAVVNKKTGKKAFVHCELHKAEDFLNTLENKEQFEIRHKWLSI